MSDGGSHQFDSTIKNFFVELSPVLEAARKLDRKMDRVFAHRFNVLDYMRTDELGLSRIIGDLFDPNASHGQGAFFLESFLSKLRERNDCVVDDNWLKFESGDIRVEVEKTIEYGRIDIYVTIKTISSDTNCLAIENKPYTHEQQNQITRYLTHLKNRNYSSYLLLYLPPTARLPSEFSRLLLNEGNLPADVDLTRFRILPYHNKSELRESDSKNGGLDQEQKTNTDDRAAFELSDLSLQFSLVDWLEECRKECDVDRLRSFLRDAKQFCLKRFGDGDMVNNKPLEVVDKYILENSTNLSTAEAVHAVWPGVRTQVCDKFLEKMAGRIKNKLDAQLQKINPSNLGKMIVQWDSPLQRRDGWFTLWISFDNWYEYKNGGPCRRTCIMMNAEKSPVDRWIYGVRLPSKDNESKKRREPLKMRLDSLTGHNLRRSSDLFPIYDFFPEYGDWSQLISDLYEENESTNNDGKISTYFVEIITMFSVSVIQIINELEGNNLDQIQA